MKPIEVVFQPGGEKIQVPPGSTILEAAAQAGLELNSACGGQGTCGKCRVLVKTSVCGEELEPVLACQTRVFFSLEAVVPPESLAGGGPEQARETAARFRDHDASSFAPPPFPVEPLVKRIPLRLPPPTLEDNTSDLDRLFRALRLAGLKNPSADLQTTRLLPRLLRNHRWEITATAAKSDSADKLIGLDGGLKPGRGFAVAIDVGTTTVVVHLLDLDSGLTLDAEACYNSQISLGDDVIRRIIFAEEGGEKELALRVRGDINRLISILGDRNKIKRREILAAICAGNPAMIAFLLRLPAENIRREPYIPPANRLGPFSAAEVGLQINRRARVYFSPGVAAFVGGDISAGVLAAGIHLLEKPALLVDIGTNGEIVLGNREWLLTCSCSAGPAFEGSGLSCGTRARNGAIDRVDLGARGEPKYSTIGGKRPVGICGSGLLDLLAELFRAGILGRDGRLLPEKGGKRVRLTDDGPAYLVARAGESDTGRDILVTQADIDNLIRAKAAVYAGISVLLKAVDLPLKELSGLYVSGGFGNYLNLDRAIRIGMLPPLSRDKIHFIGNGSVRGAKLMLLSRSAWDRAGELARMMTYFELSTDNRFMEEFTSASFLPHTNLELFPPRQNNSNRPGRADAE